MRGNPVRAKLRRGGIALGHMAFEFFTPGVSQMMANAGCEFCIFDTEHSGAGIETMEIYRTGNRLVMIMETAAGFDPERKAAADAANPAVQAWEAMMDDTGSVVAGWKNKIQAAMSHYTPTPVLAKMHEAMAKPGTAKS